MCQCRSSHQRYYGAGTGRFLTADPYQASGGPGDPGSWNRYTYVQGDPINFGDPEGLALGPLDGGIPCVVTAQVPSVPFDRIAGILGFRAQIYLDAFLGRTSFSFVPEPLRAELACESSIEDASSSEMVDLALGLASWAPGPVGFAAGLGQAGQQLYNGDTAGAAVTAACSVAGGFGKVARKISALRSLQKGFRAAL